LGQGCRAMLPFHAWHITTEASPCVIEEVLRSTFDIAIRARL
jgi:hypothetical protein